MGCPLHWSIWHQSMHEDGSSISFEEEMMRKMPHHHLATKLHHYGMRGKMLEWVNSFLSSRTQEVILEGKKSSPAPVTSGVPQGSVLAPILFLCYINDLPNQVSSTVRLFADDCLLYRNINTTHDVDTLQEDIDKLQTWEVDWLMEFNPDKCEIIRITNRRKKKIVTNYSIHEHHIKEVKVPWSNYRQKSVLE